MKKLLMAACVAMALGALAKTSTPEGWTDDYDAALKRASDEKKLVLADFSGSDWCGWCKKLDREVFDTKEFREGAKDKYVLLMVDSPSDKSLLSEGAAKRNPELVRKYRISGFPTVLLLDAKGEVVGKTGYAAGGPAKYLDSLAAIEKEAPDVAKYIKPIEDVLNRYDRQMEDEITAATKRIEAENPVEADADAKAMQKRQRKIQRKIARVMFTEVAAKYIPLYEKAFAEAKAMKVPAHMEAKKAELISGQERNFNQLKMMKAQFEQREKSREEKRAERKANKDAK